MSRYLVFLALNLFLVQGDWVPTNSSTVITSNAVVTTTSSLAASGSLSIDLPMTTSADDFDLCTAGDREKCVKTLPYIILSPTSYLAVPATSTSENLPTKGAVQTTDTTTEGSRITPAPIVSNNEPGTTTEVAHGPGAGTRFSFQGPLTDQTDGGLPATQQQQTDSAFVGVPSFGMTTATPLADNQPTATVPAPSSSANPGISLSNNAQGPAPTEAPNNSPQTQSPNSQPSNPTTTRPPAPPIILASTTLTTPIPIQIGSATITLATNAAGSTGILIGTTVVTAATMGGTSLSFASSGIVIGSSVFSVVQSAPQAMSIPQGATSNVAPGTGSMTTATSNNLDNPTAVGSVIMSLFGGATQRTSTPVATTAANGTVIFTGGSMKMEMMGCGVTISTTIVMAWWLSWL